MKDHNSLLVSLVISLAIFLASCSSEYESEGSIIGNTYTSPELGWAMDIPDGWDLVSSEETNKNISDGLNMIENSGVDVQVSGLKNLLDFKKDSFNSFGSTSEPFVEEYEGEWIENSKEIKQLLIDVFRGHGLQVASSETKNEVIDGVVFQRFEISVVGANGVSFKQLYYWTLRNGFDFGVSMMYNSEKHRDQMLNLWRNSTFGN